MKQHFLFLLYFVGTVASSLEYHGNRTYWTTVDSAGKTYIALHVLEKSVNIIFPKDKKFADIASDMKIFSPSGNGQCVDTVRTLDFTLLFDDENHIRGEIKLERFINNQKVKMYLYEKCDGDEKHNDYATGTIEDIRQDFEADGRDCFKTHDPFHPYKDPTKNIMELKSTPNGFGCQVFLVLPEYMHVEDIKLPTYDTVKPLNASFAGHDEKFWWKSKNDSMLPSAVSFDSSENVRINILKSTKNELYFFRIGSGQPIPVLKLNFGDKCNGAKFELYLNLKPECLVLFEKKNGGFMVSTKTSPYSHFKGSLSSMIFGDEHVYIKVNSPLTLKSLKVCNLSNLPDVPVDQFVLQVSPIGIANGCEKAEVVLLSSDAKNGTEVLIDRSKIIENTNTTTKGNSIVIVTTSESTESAGLEWYWYLIIGILIVGILAGIIILVFCIRRRRQKAKKPKIPVESVEDEEVGRRTITTKTAVSPEKVSKEQKPKVPDGKKNEKKKEKHVEKEATKDKPVANTNSVQPPKPVAPPPIQPSQEKHVEPPAAPKPPLPPLPLVPAKPLRNLKNRSMYGEDKRTKLDEPYDYHENESSEFKPTKTPAEFSRPDLRVHDNFWDCLAGILKTTMFCQVFADNFFNGNTNVYFMFRDLVAESVKYAPLRIFFNRILEQYEDQPRKSVPPFMEKGKKRIQTNWCYCLRVFVLSYDPLTVEIHCRGPWPHFIFDIFKCDKCGNLLEEHLKNEWKNSPVACDESWDQFVCRVKRTPINSHQFLCYYGGPGSAEPENPNDVHNIFIFRGEWEQDSLRQCARGCSIADDKSHFNECELETSLQKSPSISK